jgi:hypothetical protein
MAVIYLQARLSDGIGRPLVSTRRCNTSLTEALTYGVAISSQCSEVCASYSKGMIQITLLANLARALASTNQVGIEHVQSIAKGVALKIVLEKDFQRFHPRPGENESDNFPNPKPNQLKAKS